MGMVFDKLTYVAPPPLPVTRAESTEIASEEEIKISARSLSVDSLLHTSPRPVLSGAVVPAIPGGDRWTNILVEEDRNKKPVRSESAPSVAVVPGPKITTTLSLQDWYRATANVHPEKAPSGTLFLYAPGRMGNLLNPKELSVMDMSGIGFCLIVNLGLNYISSRRQNTLDNLKEVSDVQLETPLRMSALLSLGGSNSAVFSMWSTSIVSQTRFVSTFWKTLSSAPELAPKSAASKPAGKKTAEAIFPTFTVVSAVAAACSSVTEVEQVSAAEEAVEAAVSETGSARSARGSAKGLPSTYTVVSEVKPWIRLSRVSIGIPYYRYNYVE
jgi:hypothetical protein